MNNIRRRNFRSRQQKNNFRRRNGPINNSYLQRLVQTKFQNKNNIKKNLKNYLNSDSFRSILILFNSNSFLASPFNILPDGNLSF